MKYALIFNPGSKGGRNKKKLNIIINNFHNKNIQYELFTTKKLNDAYLYSSEVNKKGFDVIIAIGGDGTINKVLNGFYNYNGNRISKAKMGIIYTGTSPDFCKSYNIPIKIEDSIKTIFSGYSKKIKTGRITLCNIYDKENDNKFIIDNKLIEVKYFACCSNIGLGAALARSANIGIRNIFGDFLGTFICLIRSIIKYKANVFKIIINDNITDLNNLYNLSIGKTFYIASGIKVKNSLNENDDRFYALTVSDIKFSNIISILKKVYGGKEIISDHFVALSYCKKIEVAGNSQNPEIEADGDPIGFLPCKIEHSIDDLDLITKRKT